MPGGLFGAAMPATFQPIDAIIKGSAEDLAARHRGLFGDGANSAAEEQVALLERQVEIQKRIASAAEETARQGRGAATVPVVI